VNELAQEWVGNREWEKRTSWAIFIQKTSSAAKCGKIRGKRGKKTVNFKGVYARRRSCTVTSQLEEEGDEGRK